MPFVIPGPVTVVCCHISVVMVFLGVPKRIEPANAVPTNGSAFTMVVGGFVTDAIEWLDKVFYGSALIGPIHTICTIDPNRRWRGFFNQQLRFLDFVQAWSKCPRQESLIFRCHLLEGSPASSTHLLVGHDTWGYFPKGGWRARGGLRAIDS